MNTSDAGLRPCRSPYCECVQGQCTHPGCYDARGEDATMVNGLTEAETSATASVAGLSNGRPAEEALDIPYHLTRSDAHFWLANREKILQAIADQGFTLVTTAHGCRLMRLGRIEAQQDGRA